MPIDLIEACSELLSLKASHPFQEIHCTGGEVSTLRDLPKILNLLSQTGLPVSVTTAGWAGRYSGWGELLSRIPLKKIYISLDHPHKEANDAIRGPGSWNRAVRAINECACMHSGDHQLETVVVSVVHRYNIRYLEALVDLLHHMGVKRWLPAYLEGVQYYPDLAPTVSDLDWLARRRRENAVLDHALGDAFSPAVAPQRLITHGEWPEQHLPPPCITLGRLAIVHPNGEIYGCYGSEYEDVARLGDASELKRLHFKELLSRAVASSPYACRRCPEPIQHSQPLR